MGVLNVTPDSFSDGGRYLATDPAVDRALQLTEQGADIIDVGGESTRPGAQPVPVDEEMERVLPVIERLRSATSVPISIDTYKAEVATAALDAGADIVNDISAFRLDPAMSEVVYRYSAGVVLMQMRGVPRNMQEIAPSPDILAEVAEDLKAASEKALQQGMEPSQVVLDPGIGFGKTVEDNLLLLNRLEKLADLGFPILVGTSRKAFIGKVLDRQVDRRVIGTVATSVIAIMKGAHILRVHDVDECRQAAEMADAVLNTRSREPWLS